MPESSPARALLNQDSEIPSEELTLPLSDKDLQTFQLIERYRSGEKSLLELSEEIGLTKEGLRRRFKSLAYRYSGSDKYYRELIKEVFVNKILDWEERLETASDSVDVARAREGLNHCHWDSERRLPELFAPKREIKQDTTVRVVVERRKPIVIKDIDTQAR
jgi:hypothetical protein